MDSDKTRKMAAIMALGELFGKQLTDPGMRMYLRAVENLSAEAVERAASELATTGRFFPPPTELREAAGAVRHEDRAALAWGVVEGAVASVGAYRHVSFDDPLINATVRSLGGWVALCSKPVEEFDKWTRQDFVKTYTSLARTGVNGEMCAALSGLSTDGPVKHIDGTISYAAPQVEVIATGLPWAGEAPKRLGGPSPKKQAPRLALKKP